MCKGLHFRHIRIQVQPTERGIVTKKLVFWNKNETCLGRLSKSYMQLKILYFAKKNVFGLQTETEVNDRKLPTDFMKSREKALVVPLDLYSPWPLTLQKNRWRSLKKDLDLMKLADLEIFAKEISQLSWKQSQLKTLVRGGNPTLLFGTIFCGTQKLIFVELWKLLFWEKEE